MTVPLKATPDKPARSARPAKAASTGARPSGGSSRPSPAPTAPVDAASAESKEPGRPQGALTRAQAIRELADRANRGSEEALGRLRQLLDDSPEIWQHVGDLARHAELAWLDLLTGADHLMREAIKRHIARMKDELLGPHPTPMERLLADQAVACYLAAQHAETCLAAPGNHSLAQAAMRLRRSESAQKRYLAALKTLARLRANVPQGMAPISALRLHDGERQQA